jgi:hypothetical protein
MTDYYDVEMNLKIGDKILYGDRKATLINPITPSGMKNGQLWEMKFDALPCNVIRWCNPDLVSVVSKNTKEGKPE